METAIAGMFEKIIFEDDVRTLKEELGAAAPAVFFMRTADPIRRFDIAPAPAPIPGTASMVRTTAAFFMASAWGRTSPWWEICSGKKCSR